MNETVQMRPIESFANLGVRIEFSHVTRYKYSGPVRFNPHRLVLRPRESYHQRLEKIELSCSVDSRMLWSEDVSGNMIATLEFNEASDELEIVSNFTVWRSPPPEGAHGPEGVLVTIPLYYSGLEEAPTYLYRRSGYPPQVEQVRSWVMNLGVMGTTLEPFPLFDRLALKIYEQIKYARREEKGVQSPKDTLRLKSGSCRDMAVLMMEAARSVGFAARFVSGYFDCETSRVGHGSTHAWMEVYLPQRGWTGYDPSIGKLVGIGHISVGVSHHPRGVMPIAGSFDSLGNMFSGMSVSISSKRFEAVSPKN